MRSLGALIVGLLLATGCATTLDKARSAWAGGEGDFDEAEDLYREAAKDPVEGEVASEELVDIYLQLAKEQAKSKPKGAAEYYRKALKYAPKHEQGLTELARVLRDLGQTDEALKVAEDGVGKGCRACKTVMADLLIRRANARMQESQWAQAEEDYSRALTILPDSSVALGVVRARYGRKDAKAAAEALRAAVDLIGAGDSEGRRQFLELRRGIVLLALEDQNAPLADELLDLAPTGVGGEAQLGLAIEVAMEFRKRGDPDTALLRMTALVQAVDDGKLHLSEARMGELRDQVAGLYAARAAKLLSQGDVQAADQDLERALTLRPKDPALMLQRVLIVAGRGNLAKAIEALGRIDRKVKGYDQVDAILMAMQVDKLLESGRIKDAEAELARARKKGAELPEVHIATAQVLAVTPAKGLRKKELSQLRRRGLVSYPGGKVNRVGEALSELDWSRQQIAGLGVTYPYRAPGTKERIEALEDRIARFFPYKVKFHGEPKTVLHLKNSGSASVKVELKADGLSRSASIPAGGTEKIVVPDPGLLQLRYRGTDATLLAEPYTELEVSI